MNFFITSETSYEVTTPNTLDLENQLQEFFEKKEYGIAIDKISTIVICVSEKFENLHPLRLPKISRNKVLFEYKLDFQIYKSMDDEERKKYIATEYLKNIINVFENKKVKGFDSKAFLNDLEMFFKSKGILEHS